MPFGTEVGLGPGDIVLDGDPAPIVAKRSLTSATAELLFLCSFYVLVRFF